MPREGTAEPESWLGGQGTYQVTAHSSSTLLKCLVMRSVNVNSSKDVYQAMAALCIWRGGSMMNMKAQAKE